MRTGTATTALAASLLLALTACSSDSDPKPPTPTATATRAYTYQDCAKLLEYDFQQGTPRDASKDPECAHLSPNDYQRAVGEVLTNHKDEILNPSQTP